MISQHVAIIMDGNGRWGIKKNLEDLVTKIEAIENM